MEALTVRSELTRTAIVDTALQMALDEGLERITVGEVAKRLGLSKSGVFSRIGSREALQVAVVEEYDRRFLQDVFTPAMREAPGLPRLDRIMRQWMVRADTVKTRHGCLYSAGAFEYDDIEGPVRDKLLDGVQRWRQALRRCALQAIEHGHLRPDTEADQLVFEMDALFIGLMRDARFLRDPRALGRALRAWERLLADARPPVVAGTASPAPSP